MVPSKTVHGMTRRASDAGSAVDDAAKARIDGLVANAPLPTPQQAARLAVLLTREPGGQAAPKSKDADQSAD